MKTNNRLIKIDLNNKKYSFFRHHLKGECYYYTTSKKIIDFFDNLESSNNDFNVRFNNKEINKIKNEYFQFSEFVTNSKFVEFNIDEINLLIFCDSPDIIVVTNKQVFAIEVFSLCDYKFHNHNQKIVCYDQPIIGKKQNEIVDRHLNNYDKYLDNIKREFNILSNEVIKIIYFIYAIDNDDENGVILDEKICNHFRRGNYNVSWYIKIS